MNAVQPPREDFDLVSYINPDAMDSPWYAGEPQVSMFDNTWPMDFPIQVAAPQVRGDFPVCGTVGPEQDSGLGDGHVDWPVTQIRGELPVYGAVDREQNFGLGTGYGLQAPSQASGDLSVYRTVGPKQNFGLGIGYVDLQAAQIPRNLPVSEMADFEQSVSFGTGHDWHTALQTSGALPVGEEDDQPQSGKKLRGGNKKNQESKVKAGKVTKSWKLKERNEKTRAGIPNKPKPKPGPDEPGPVWDHETDEAENVQLTDEMIKRNTLDSMHIVLAQENNEERRNWSLKAWGLEANNICFLSRPMAFETSVNEQAEDDLLTEHGHAPSCRCVYCEDRPAAYIEYLRRKMTPNLVSRKMRTAKDQEEDNARVFRQHRVRVNRRRTELEDRLVRHAIWEHNKKAGIVQTKPVVHKYGSRMQGRTTQSNQEGGLERSRYIMHALSPNQAKHNGEECVFDRPCPGGSHLVQEGCLAI